MHEYQLIMLPGVVASVVVVVVSTVSETIHRRLSAEMYTLHDLPRFQHQQTPFWRKPHTGPSVLMHPFMTYHCQHQLLK